MLWIIYYRIIYIMHFNCICSSLGTWIDCQCNKENGKMWSNGCEMWRLMVCDLTAGVIAWWRPSISSLSQHCVSWVENKCRLSHGVTESSIDRDMGHRKLRHLYWRLDVLTTTETDWKSIILSLYFLRGWGEGYIYFFKMYFCWMFIAFHITVF